MDNFTYTRHQLLQNKRKWRISAECVWKNICALVYHNPLVGGPNPSAATRINKRPDGSFVYSVRRGGDGHPDGGPTRRQKADGSMPVPRSFNEGGFAQGNEAQRNQSTALLPRFPGWPGFFILCHFSRFYKNFCILAEVAMIYVNRIVRLICDRKRGNIRNGVCTGGCVILYLM